MKNLIQKLIASEGNCEEISVFITQDLWSIEDYETSYNNLKPQDIDIYLDIKTPPSFSRIERELNITMHPELVDFWSQIWCPGFSIINKKSVTEIHTDDQMHVNFLRSQSHLDHMIDDIEMYSEEMNDFGVDGVFFPIGFKEDSWIILFNNNDGAVYISEHDPCGYVKAANSIKEFFES